MANFLTTHVVRFAAISLVSAGLAGCWGEDELSLDHEKIAWVHKISIPDWSRDRTAERISSPIITIPAGDRTFLLHEVENRKAKIRSWYFLHLNATSNVKSRKRVFTTDSSDGHAKATFHVLHSSSEKISLGRQLLTIKKRNGKALKTLSYSLFDLDTSGKVLRDSTPIELVGNSIILGSWRVDSKTTLIVCKKQQIKEYGLYLALLDNGGRLIRERHWPAVLAP